MTGRLPARPAVVGQRRGGRLDRAGQRVAARRQAPLEGDVRRLGAEGVVIAGMQLRVRERDCPAAVGRHDHIVEATLTGTAIARFSPAGHHRASPALTVMPLGPQRRQAARAPDIAAPAGHDNRHVPRKLHPR